MIISRIQGEIQNKKVQDGDYLADVLIDICFQTSYKVEDLLSMPPKRLDRIIERFRERFCNGGKK